MSALEDNDAELNDTENDANNNSNDAPVSGSSPSKSSRWPAAAVLQSPETEVRQIPRFIFDPDGSPIFYWTAAVAMATLYNAWMIALRISFPEIRNENAHFTLWCLDMLSDLIYLADILVQLRTAYLLDGIPVFEPSKIRQQYMGQTYFIQDVISVLPSQTILSFLPDAVGCCKYFLCTAGAARLTRLLKFHVLYKFYDLAESFTSNPHLIRVLRLFLNLAIIIHWIACLYYLLSEYEGLGSNLWVYTNATDQQLFSRKYIICLYWSAMTLTTIGNTNSPETDLEYIFTGIIFLFGVFVFATVMGNVGDVISSMNANRQEFQARMDHIQMYLTHKKVPASLQLKIKKWAEYTWSRTKATDESRLLNMLPERLRAEVAVHVHLDSLKKVKIFEQCETGFLCELVLKLRSQVYSPGDYVCRIGETGREMFIINHGKVEVLVPSPATNKDMVVAVLSEGNYFGEISLLRLDGVQNRRTADVRSIGYSELLCLSRRDLMAALVEYPEAKSVLEAQAKKRMKTNLQAQRAFSVDTFLRSSQDYSSTDSGILSKDDLRGHDVSEIKAMIEELKNANKVPGRTIWQLIARCEILQAKMTDKEQEIQNSRRRIRELEELLLSCHSLRRDEMAVTTETERNSFLRPTGRVIKQYSQDEGRCTLEDSEVIPNEKLELQSRAIPDVKITRPASEAGSLDDDQNMKRIFGEDNFIKTSKIDTVRANSNTNYDLKKSVSSTRDLNKFTDSYIETMEEPVAADTIDRKFRELVKDENSFTFFAENVSDKYFPVNYESSLKHELYMENSNEISFKSKLKQEVYYTSPVDFNVQTIPEEDEDTHIADDARSSANVTSYSSSTNREIFSNARSISRAFDSQGDANNDSVFVSKPVTKDFPSDEVTCLKLPADNRHLFSKNFGRREILESDSEASYLKLNSVSDCCSEDSSSRRDSLNFDSEYDSEEDLSTV